MPSTIRSGRNAHVSQILVTRSVDMAIGSDTAMVSPDKEHTSSTTGTIRPIDKGDGDRTAVSFDEDRRPLPHVEQDQDTQAAGQKEQECETDDEDKDEDDTLMFTYEVDLHKMEAQHNRAPIFTRSLLEQIRREKHTIQRMTNIPERFCTITNLPYTTPTNSTYKIWKLDPTLEQTNRIDIHFMPRVVLHPEFQKNFSSYTKSIPLLQQYNDIQPNDQVHLSVPYTFQVNEEEYLDEHLDHNLMEKYRHALKHSSRLWKQSKSRGMLLETILSATATSTPITSIVCFGLGRIRLDKEFYHSAMQHMAVFDIGTVLSNRSNGNIEILLQDPMYEQRDWTLLRELHRDMGCEGNSNVRFVSDPDGLLAITSSTLVVTAFLVVQYPLLQIIADLFKEGSGPAAILCDRLEVDPRKNMYTIRDRGSPAVARMLLGRYRKLDGGFEGYDLDKHLRDDTYGVEIDNEALKHRFWLPTMDLYVRKREQA